MALMMARLYTGAHDIVALRSVCHHGDYHSKHSLYETSCNNTFVVLGYRNSYHGMSPVTMELTNMSSWKFQLPRLQGVQCVS